MMLLLDPYLYGSSPRTRPVRRGRPQPDVIGATWHPQRDTRFRCAATSDWPSVVDVLDFHDIAVRPRHWAPAHRKPSHRDAGLQASRCLKLPLSGRRRHRHSVLLRCRWIPGSPGHVLGSWREVRGRQHEALTPRPCSVSNAHLNASPRLWGRHGRKHEICIFNVVVNRVRKLRTVGNLNAVRICILHVLPDDRLPAVR